MPVAKKVVALRKRPVFKKRPAKKLMSYRKKVHPKKRLGRVNRADVQKIKNIAGLPDSAFVKLNYSSTSAFSLSGTGAPTFVKLKLNSVYQPYVGNTDSSGGQARMYSSYTRSVIRGSRVNVRVWSDTLGNQEPLRIVIIPCNLASYNTYSAYTNIVALKGVPHSKLKLYSPGAQMPSLSAYCSHSMIQYGDNKHHDLIADANASSTSGTDPAVVNYWLIGFQTMAGTTALDVQAEISITHYCEFYRQVASSIPQLWNGSNEMVVAPSDEKPKDLLKKSSPTVITSEEDYEVIRVPKSSKK
ncbi:MAG: capsid protein [Wigfec virus K19_615]|nr:MAG: capsid protein [Wigfec virus K19_615]